MKRAYLDFPLPAIGASSAWFALIDHDWLRRSDVATRGFKSSKRARLLKGSNGVQGGNFELKGILASTACLRRFERGMMDVFMNEEYDRSE